MLHVCIFRIIQNYTPLLKRRNYCALAGDLICGQSPMCFFAYISIFSRSRRKKSKKPMPKSKLYEALESLSGSQKRSYLATLNIRENHLSAEDQALGRDFFAEVVEPSFPASEDQFWRHRGLSKKEANKIKNRLLRSVDRFLMLETLEEEPRLKHLLLARKYGMMGLSKHLRHHYCIKRVQLYKDPRFAKEFICIFDQLAKENRHLDKGGQISVERLVKCIVFGIIAGEMEWLEAMLDRLEAQIDLEGEEERQAFRSFANCYIDIHWGTTGRVYEDLRRFRESRLYRKYYALKAGADRLLLKLYFEKGEHDALASLMNSVRVSVEKSGFGEDTKRGMLAFFEVLFELSKNKKPLTWELARGWHLIDQVWAKRICQ